MNERAQPQHDDSFNSGAEFYRSLDSAPMPEATGGAEALVGKDIILEIGAGGSMVAEPIPVRRSFGAHETYVGIDLAQERSLWTHQTEVAWQRLQQAHPDESLNFMKADGRHLPFADHSVNEVLLSNVLGSGISQADCAAILREAMRVKKPGGAVAIHEDITPSEEPSTEMVELLRSIGADPAQSSWELIRRGDDPQAYQAAAARFGFRRDPYISEEVTHAIRQTAEESEFTYRHPGSSGDTIIVLHSLAAQSDPEPVRPWYRRKSKP